jgi:hypothetical protein
MIRFYILITATIVSMMLVSCQPKPGLTLDEGKLCRPHNLVIDSTGNGYAKIAWDPGCPGTRIMRGFNIYVSPEPLAQQYPGGTLPGSIKPFNKEIYPGDTEGKKNRESYELEEIANATIHYVHVRVVNSDKSLSPPTNEIKLVCYAQGEFTLSVSYSDEQAGFSFAKNAHCRTDDLENDLYFYHKDGHDYLCSPSRLSPVNRVSKIYSAGTGNSLGDVSTISPRGNHAEKVELIPNGIYVVITEEGHPVKLRVERIEGQGDSRKVIFEYIYKPPAIGQGAS